MKTLEKQEQFALSQKFLDICINCELKIKRLNAEIEVLKGSSAEFTSAVYEPRAVKKSTKEIKDRIAKLTKEIEENQKVIEDYKVLETLTPNTWVRNGKPIPGQVIELAETNSSYPQVWVKFESGLQELQRPSDLTPIDIKELSWQWEAGELIRSFDGLKCDDFKFLLEEHQSCSRCLKTAKQAGDWNEANRIKARQDLIEHHWSILVRDRFRINDGFIYQGKPVIITGYEMFNVTVEGCQKASLLYPLIKSDDINNPRFGDPSQLEAIPLGQQIKLLKADGRGVQALELGSSVSPSRRQTAEGLSSINETKIDEINDDASVDPLPSNICRGTSWNRIPARKPRVIPTPLPSLIIDPEFKTLIQPLSPEERSQLENNLITYGCRDALVVWKGHNILIDGHNRYEICKEQGLKFEVVEIELRDRASVNDWIINNQLGRRNLTKEYMSYLRGKLYDNQKDSHGGDRKSRGKSCLLKTEDKIAELTKVSPRTIKNDSKFSQAVDKLAEHLGQGIKPQILNKELKITKSEVEKLAEVVEEKPEEVKEVVESIANGEKSGRAIQLLENKPEVNFEVDQIVRINSNRTDSRLIGYNKAIALITEVFDSSVNLRIWQTEIENVSKNDLEPIEGKITLCDSFEPEYIRELMINNKSLEDFVVGLLKRQKQLAQSKTASL